MSELTKIDDVGGVAIYAVAGKVRSFIFKAGLTIDADGSPNCYGPGNTGIDWTENGGTPGSDWWGGPIDGDGYPLTQRVYDPSPGMYVSATAHFDPAYGEQSQYRYINSESIPFIVLPGGHSCGAKLGDVCLCFNERTDDNCYGIYADIGPSSKIGEASIRMAEALQINADPKIGGIESKTIVYLVFPESVASWKPPNVWFDVANTLTKSWGGLTRLKKLAAEI